MCELKQNITSCELMENSLDHLYVGSHTNLALPDVNCEICRFHDNFVIQGCRFHDNFVIQGKNL